MGLVPGYKTACPWPGCPAAIDTAAGHFEMPAPPHGGEWSREEIDRQRKLFFQARELGHRQALEAHLATHRAKTVPPPR